jgi:hypothetical protein
VRGVTYTIHKFQFEVTSDPQDISMPLDAEFLTGHDQHGYVTLWYRWNQDVTAVERHRFWTVGTGWDAPARSEAGYVGSAFSASGYVWHLFHKRLS